MAFFQPRCLVESGKKVTVTPNVQRRVDAQRLVTLLLFVALCGYTYSAPIAKRKAALEKKK